MYDVKNLNIWKQETGRIKADYSGADIEELNLSVRSYNCLRRAGCNTVGDLLRLLEEDQNGLRQIRNLGSRSEEEILAHVEQYWEENRGKERGKPGRTVYKYTDCIKDNNYLYFIKNKEK